jgi:hypothetical protein
VPDQNPAGKSNRTLCPCADDGFLLFASLPCPRLPVPPRQTPRIVPRSGTQPIAARDPGRRVAAVGSDELCVGQLGARHPGPLAPRSWHFAAPRAPAENERAASERHRGHRIGRWQGAGNRAGKRHERRCSAARFSGTHVHPRRAAPIAVPFPRSLSRRRAAQAPPWRESFSARPSHSLSDRCGTDRRSSRREERARPVSRTTRQFSVPWQPPGGDRLTDAGGPRARRAPGPVAPSPGIGAPAPGAAGPGCHGEGTRPCRPRRTAETRAPTREAERRNGGTVPLFRLRVRNSVRVDGPPRRRVAAWDCSCHVGP